MPSEPLEHVTESYCLLADKLVALVSRPSV
jgi:hypothetical protein